MATEKIWLKYNQPDMDKLPEIDAAINRSIDPLKSAREENSRAKYLDLFNEYTTNLSWISSGVTVISGAEEIPLGRYVHSFLDKGELELATPHLDPLELIDLVFSSPQEHGIVSKLIIGREFSRAGLLFPRENEPFYDASQLMSPGNLLSQVSKNAPYGQIGAIAFTYASLKKPFAKDIGFIFEMVDKNLRD